MRILHVCPLFQDIPNSGGIGQFVRNIARAQRKRGMEPEILCNGRSRGEPARSCWSSLEGDIYINRVTTVNPFSESSSSLGLPVFGGKPAYDDFDMIHTHDYRTIIGELSVIFSRFKERKSVIQPHGSFEDVTRRVPKRIFDMSLGRVALMFASGAISMSNLEDSSLGHYFREDRIQRITNGIMPVDYEEFRRTGIIRNRLGIGDNSTLVTYVGRMTRMKGIELVLESGIRLMKNNEDISLLFVGAGDKTYLDELWQKIPSHLQGRINYFGPVNDLESKKSILADSDLFVLPSYYETFPTSVIEALCCNCRVLLTSECQSMNLFEDLCSIVPPEAQAIGEAISKSIADGDSRSDRMARRRIALERFSIEPVAKTVCDFYREIGA